jgi:hypothetical protein
MNRDHLWPLLPALAVVLLHLDTFAHDARRLTAWVWRVGRGLPKQISGTPWRVWE